MFAQGQLNWGLPVSSNAQNTGLLTTSELLGIGNRQSRLVDHVVNGTTDIRMFPTRGRGVTGRVPISEDQLNTKNTTAYRWVPGYGYKKVTQEPSTSLKFFERKLSKLSEAERAGVPKRERNQPFKEKQLTEHVKGDEAVKMFKEYGGEPIPERSINGE